MADAKPEATYTVSSSSTAPRRGVVANVVAHFKRFWWLHLIVLVCVVIVIIFPMSVSTFLQSPIKSVYILTRKKSIYVAYPKIAQTDVNNATLNVTSLVFSNPTPNSIHANQTQVLGNKAIYHPKIYSFNASLGLAGAPSPVSYATVPDTQSEDGQVIVVDATLPLNNIGAATDFTKAVLASDTWELSVYGRPELREMVLPKSTVTFNKTVKMTG